MSALVLHVTGARPNFPKAAPVIRALEGLGVSQRLVHTGQHYDERLSSVFFKQLGLPEPDINLGVGSTSQTEQTATIMVRLNQVVLETRPGLLVVYGDVNSTVAAALVAAKAGIPLAHVEAGLRSFDRSMPEEINRLVTDRLSDLLFATSPEAVANLGSEGVSASQIHFVGNPMIDTLLAHLDQFDPDRIRTRLAVRGPYVAATLHRPSNVDDALDVADLVKAIHAVADHVQVVIPLHPRGRARLEGAGLDSHRNLRLVDPLGYIEFLSLVRGAAAVVTDSGGVQEETTILGIPCLTLRSTTERPVTITNGTNQLVSRADLPQALRAVLAERRPVNWPTPPLWDGRAGARIAGLVHRFVGAG